MDHLKVLLLSIIAVFVPIEQMAIVALVLVGADLVSGIIKAKKNGETITSAGLRRTLVKACVYEIALALGFLGQQYLTGPNVPIENIIGTFIAITELTSIFENMNIIAGQNLLSALVSKVGSFLPKQ